MLLQINSEKTINDLQKDFSSAYPFLKLEFFKDTSSSANKKLQQQPLKFILKPAGKKGSLPFGDSTQVIELEKAFLDEFGLHVQVFRKSGNLWLETTFTDRWTLKQQNDHGREISVAHGYPVETPDFDINRDADH